jgi:cell shape-determining protein MreD
MWMMMMMMMRNLCLELGLGPILGPVLDLDVARMMMMRMMMMMIGKMRMRRSCQRWASMLMVSVLPHYYHEGRTGHYEY